MNDFSAFIEGKISEKNLDMNAFFARIDISRSSYYRYLKNGNFWNDPEKKTKFNQKTVDKIAEVLNLTYEECKIYFNYVPDIIKDYTSQCKESLNGIFSYRSPIDGAHTTTDFTYYSPHVSKEKNKFDISMISVNETAKRIVDSIKVPKKIKSGFYHRKLTIKIYGGVDNGIAILIARLVNSIEKILFVNNEDFRIKVLHYLTDYQPLSKDDLVSKFELFKQTLPLRGVCCEYEQHYDTQHTIWPHNDMMVIKYSCLFVPEGVSIRTERSKNNGNRSQTYQHFLVKFKKDPIVGSPLGYICSLGEPLYLYRFFAADNRELANREEEYPNVFSINDVCNSHVAEHDVISIGNDYFLDNINPKHWEQLKENVLKDDNTIDYCKKCFFLNSYLLENRSTESDSLDILIKGIATRYDNKCKRRDITILYEDGIRDFVEKRMITDFGSNYIPENFKFSKSTVDEILQETIDSINNNNTSLQRYYIVRRKKISSLGIKMWVARDSGIGVSDIKSFTKFKSTISLHDSKMANKIFDFWENEINNRQSSIKYAESSLLMTDKEAVEFLEKLQRN